jgi:hypothetical protein
MESTLKDYMADQQVEGIAHIVMCNFEKLTERELTEDEREFVLSVAVSTFDKYVVERKSNIYVTDDMSRDQLSDLLEDFTSSLSTLIVHYIYSRLEAYILYKQVKTLQE